MAISQRLNEKRTHMKENRMERDLDRAEHETLELKVENRSLHDQVERDQQERDRLVELLEKLERAYDKGGHGKRGRGRTVAVLGLGGLAAWAFGSRSGRRKVAQIKERMKGDPMAQDVREHAHDIAHQTRDAAQDISQQTKGIAKQAKDAAQDIAKQAKDAGQDLAEQTKERMT